MEEKSDIISLLGPPSWLFERGKKMLIDIQHPPSPLIPLIPCSPFLPDPLARINIAGMPSFFSVDVGDQSGDFLREKQYKQTEKWNLPSGLFSEIKKRRGGGPRCRRSWYRVSASLGREEERGEGMVFCRWWG